MKNWIIADRSLILSFMKILEQFEINFTNKLNTVIADKLETKITERMQPEFNKFEGELDLKLVKLRGELM